MYITRFITRIKIIITKNDDDDDDDNNNNNNNNYNSDTDKIPGTVSINELQPKAHGLNPVLQKLNKQNNTKKKVMIIIMIRNVPDIFLSVAPFIRQQLIKTKMYRKKKLQENVDEMTGRVCSNDQETASHILMW